MSDESRHTGLKLLVIFMGVLLLAGMIALGALIVVKSRGGERSIAASGPPVGEACAASHVDLTALGRVREAHLRGRTAQLVLVRAGGTTTLLTLDACNGKTLQRLTVTAAP